MRKHEGDKLLAMDELAFSDEQYTHTMICIHNRKKKREGNICQSMMDFYLFNFRKTQRFNKQEIKEYSRTKPRNIFFLRTDQVISNNLERKTSKQKSRKRNTEKENLE